MWIRVLLGGPTPGGANSKKLGILGDIKLQIFGAEGAENFVKIRFFMENWLLYGILSKNLAKFRLI